MQKNTNTIPDSHGRPFLTAHIQTDSSCSASETLQTGLRLSKETRLKHLRTALEEGEQSGTTDYSLKKLLSEIDG